MKQRAGFLLRCFVFVWTFLLLPLASGCGGGSASGSVEVQVSGEELAAEGLRFPAGSEVTIADGWEIRFTHLLVSVQRVWLSENPDTNPSDQSQTGEMVAEAVGPWVIDLAKEGDVPIAQGGGTAVRLTTLDKLTERGDAPIEVGERYAVSFELKPPEASANVVNFADDSEAMELFEEMIQKGYTVVYVGTATFKGTACTSSDDTYDFSILPETVDIRLGFATPVSYLNCQNQRNGTASISGETYVRGVAIVDNEPSLAQLTMHLEHPFYSKTSHEPALYFDQLAALLVGEPAGTILTTDFAVGVDPSAFTDGEGTPLPWRVCDGTTTAPNTAQRYFDTGSVPLNPGASPSSALRDYRDFLHYVQSTQGHLNGGEGICFTKRSYPSPN